MVDLSIVMWQFTRGYINKQINKYIYIYVYIYIMPINVVTLVTPKPIERKFLFNKGQKSAPRSLGFQWHWCWHWCYEEHTINDMDVLRLDLVFAIHVFLWNSDTSVFCKQEYHLKQANGTCHFHCCDRPSVSCIDQSWELTFYQYSFVPVAINCNVCWPKKTRAKVSARTCSKNLPPATAHLQCKFRESI